MPGGTTNAAWPREPSSRSTEATTTWTFGDAAVGRPRLLAVEDPLVLGLVVDARACAATRRPSRRRARRRRRRRPSAPRACRSTAGSTRPSARRCRWPKIAGDRERGAHDRHADAGVAPEQLLVDDRQRQAGRVGVELGERLEAVEADLRRLLDDRPRASPRARPTRRRRGARRPRRSRAPSRARRAGPRRARGRRRRARRPRGPWGRGRCPSWVGLLGLNDRVQTR